MYKYYITPNTEAECERLSAEKAEAEGCNMESSIHWWDWGQDATGWYLLMEEDSNI